MTTKQTTNNVTVYTTFENGVMVSSRMETEDRILSIDLGRVSKTWSISLDSKTQHTAMGHNKNLRTYVGKDWDYTVSYWDKKLNEFQILQ